MSFDGLRRRAPLDKPSANVPQRASSIARRCLLLCGVLLATTPARATNAVIVIPNDAPRAQRMAAETLQRYIARATRVTFPIRASAGAGLSLHVGRSPFVEQLDLNLADLGEDGYLLSPAGGANYVITGHTAWGTETAVYAFCERVLGVRWLLPGAVGEHVPNVERLTLPGAPIRSKPAFWSRLGSGLTGSDTQLWARRLGMRGKVEFHHKLWALVPPDRYLRSDPQFFPEVDGERVQPAPGAAQQRTWQPNFAAPGTVNAAVQSIERILARDPRTRSVSLGVNDSTVFDRSDASVALDGDRRNGFGYRSASNSYYRWCNAVIERVSQRHPELLYGCLAYNNVAEPPDDVTVSPQLVPFICEGRYQWLRPEHRDAGRRLNDRWKRAAHRYGWYDYHYGGTYMLPRVYHDHLRDTIAYAAEQGVGAMYAELYPNWADGPTAYLYLKLLWDPQQDVDALVREWCELCVGRAAAPHLQQYLSIWEQFWTQTVPQSDWLQRRQTYAPFHQLSYLDLVDEQDLARSRALLERCVAEATTDQQRARANLLLDGFAYYEASALAYRATRVGLEQPVATEDEARTALTDAAKRLHMADQRHVISRMLTQRATVKFHTPHPAAWAQGETWGLSAFWRLYGWAVTSSEFRADLAKLRAAATPNRKLWRALRDMTVAATQDQPQLLGNTDFAIERRDWGLRIEERPGEFETAREGRSDDRSLRIVGARKATVLQRIDVTPGRYLVTAWLKLEQPTDRGYVRVLAIPFRADGSRPRYHDTRVRPSVGDWRGVAWPIEVTATSNVVRLEVGVIAHDLQDSSLLVDDVQLLRLP